MKKLAFTGVRIDTDSLLELRSRKVNISLLVRDLLEAYLAQDNREIDYLKKDLQYAEQEERQASAKVAALKAKIKKKEEIAEKERKTQELKMNHYIDEDLGVR